MGREQTEAKREVGNPTENILGALAGSSVGWSTDPHTKSLRSIPGQGACLNCGVDPHLERMWEAVDQCFSFSIPLSLKSIKIDRGRRLWLLLTGDGEKKEDGGGCRGAETGGLRSWNCLMKEGSTQHSQLCSLGQFQLTGRNPFLLTSLPHFYTLFPFLSRKMFSLKNPRLNSNELNETVVCPHTGKAAPEGHGHPGAPHTWGAKREHA